MNKFQSFPDFPYEEVRSESGDGFQTFKEAKDAGFDDDQIWSVVTGDDGHWTKEKDGTYLEWQCFTYGPANHFVNVLYYIATNERHDGQTYYEDWFDIERDAEDIAEMFEDVDIDSYIKEQS